MIYITFNQRTSDQCVKGLHLHQPNCKNASFISMLDGCWVNLMICESDNGAIGVRVGRGNGWW